jgi:hypothetical protein
MKTAQAAIAGLFLQFSQAVKNGMHKNYIRIGAVDARGENQIKLLAGSRRVFLPSPAILSVPSQELNDMWAGDGKNFTPTNASCLFADFLRLR